MVVKHIRKRLYQAIMLPLVALFFIAAAPLGALAFSIVYYLGGRKHK